MSLFVQHMHSGEVNLYPPNAESLRWLSLTIAKFTQWSVIRDNQGGWVGFTAYTDDHDVIQKIANLYDDEENKKVPAWSQQSRETNMQMSKGYRDFMKKQDTD